jgi:hypothetical protein
MRSSTVAFFRNSFRVQIAMSARRHFGYRIRNDGDYWTWAVIDGSGAVKQQGQAATKAVAAAYVIRELAPRAMAGDRQSDAA